MINSVHHAPNPRTRLLNRQLNPLLTGLPERFGTFRPQQVEAIREAVRWFDGGCEMVVVDAPTGSGKTLIGETIRQLLSGNACYVCNSKSLQQQFKADFQYSELLQGRSNYRPQRGGQWSGRWGVASTCDDCTWTRNSPHCLLCESKGSCPYEIQKEATLASKLAVLNTAYFLTEANGPHKFSGRDLVIVDEADTLEDQLMKYVEVSVGTRRMQQYGWSAPKMTVEDDWQRWVDDVLPDVEERMKKVGGSTDEREVREGKWLRGLRQNLEVMERDFSEKTSTWVYTGDRERVAFKPARVNGYGTSMLWDHGRRWLLMSATVISADDLLWSLGWKKDYKVISLDSTFPIKNRLVKIRPVANMSRSENEVGKLIGEIRRIAAHHSGDRILVHTVNYRLTASVARALRLLFPRRAVETYASAADREPALARYRATEGAILVAPSMDRGIDLSGDECRVQVIAKVPFPSLGDRQVAARLYSGNEGRTWYLVQTVRSIVQMTGRAVRSEDDWATTYVLDTQFGDRVWADGKRLFPKWWRDSVVWERVGTTN